MDKIILVMYFNVDHLSSPLEISDYMGNMKQQLTPKEEEFIIYGVPVRNQESKIECINPKLVSEEDYKQAKEILDRNKLIVEQIIRKQKI